MKNLRSKESKHFKKVPMNCKRNLIRFESLQIIGKQLENYKRERVKKALYSKEILILLFKYLPLIAFTQRWHLQKNQISSTGQQIETCGTYWSSSGSP